MSYFGHLAPGSQNGPRVRGPRRLSRERTRFLAYSLSSSSHVRVALQTTRWRTPIRTCAVGSPSLDRVLYNQRSINSPDFSSFSASWSRCASATDMPGWQAATRGPGSSEPGSFFSESPGDEFGLLAQSALT